MSFPSASRCNNVLSPVDGHQRKKTNQISLVQLAKVGMLILQTPLFHPSPQCYLEAQ